MSTVSNTPRFGVLSLITKDNQVHTKCLSILKLLSTAVLLVDSEESQPPHIFVQIQKLQTKRSFEAGGNFGASYLIIHSWSMVGMECGAIPCHHECTNSGNFNIYGCQTCCLSDNTACFGLASVELQGVGLKILFYDHLS